ncbi:nucleotide exchange factor GrpE [Kamptonema animale CS-326]|jgi:molecular chaperone GrpE|uniref:nucleotide exchange factor GrpE n=1 Tax=Kamptonema TaxID=1501433 RepID=UPI00034D35D3|nr:MULTISPECIES: nucleotide exchange factor GrpE [Kamptonema]MDB9513749.1 nucleotide exchange factor GrpE [Kamptonema animale CS-326]
MIDEENQQYHDPNSAATAPEGVQAVDETPPADGNLNEPLDWELQIAQAYQSSEASQPAGNAPSTSGGNFADPGLAEALEFLKAELASATKENESLKAQVQASSAQVDDLKNQNLRLAADFENFRRRTAKEKEELDLQVKCATIMELLPVIDNFERARSHIKPQTDGEMGIHKSYQSVYKQMVDCLKRVGVSPMRPEGQPFDPNLHEAVMREPTDQYEEGTVAEELVRGYMLGERVLRHAMVKVAAAPEPASEEVEPQ